MKNNSGGTKIANETNVANLNNDENTNLILPKDSGLPAVILVSMWEI